MDANFAFKYHACLISIIFIHLFFYFHSCIFSIFTNFDTLNVGFAGTLSYTSVASELVSKLPNPLGVFNMAATIFKSFYSHRIGLRSNFCLSPVSSHFIRKELSSLNARKAVELDDISSLFLRDGADCIIEPVAHIVNISITTETVPSAFKEAKVIPLFKKGSTLDPGNYRPVSILCVLSKIRAVHSQLSIWKSGNYFLRINQVFAVAIPPTHV